jgi:hypothetical protein
MIRTQFSVEKHAFFRGIHVLELVVNITISKTDRLLEDTKDVHAYRSTQNLTHLCTDVISVGSSSLGSSLIDDVCRPFSLRCETLRSRPERSFLLQVSQSLLSPERFQYDHPVLGRSAQPLGRRPDESPRDSRRSHVSSTRYSGPGSRVREEGRI